MTMEIEVQNKTVLPFDESRYISENPAPDQVMADLQSGKVVVLRAVPEILKLGEKILEIAFELGGAKGRDHVSALMQKGSAEDLEALSLFYRGFRAVLDSRYVSCLFSDLIKSFNVPQPLLIDSAYCRMVLARNSEVPSQRPDLFDPAEFQPRGPNDREGLIAGSFWGGPHRDIDARHGHFQFNLWFPMHFLSKEQSLLFFPEVYRSNVQQYSKGLNPNNPSEWGLGHSLSVPLNFGDTVIFHSQMVHASPSQALDKDRMTVEIRIAAGAMDGNSRVYRRLFWNTDNFETSANQQLSTQARAEELLTTFFDREPTLGKALEAHTAHGIVHRLFADPYTSLDAAFMNSSAAALAGMLRLTSDEWDRLLERLDTLPSGEDFDFMLARIANAQENATASERLIRKILLKTQSFHWCLQAGRLAEELRFDDLAIECFRKTIGLAQISEFALDRFTPNMPPPRSEGLLQLFPKDAASIAEWFIKRIEAGRMIYPNPGGLDPLLLYSVEPPARYASPPRFVRKVFSRLARMWKNRGA